MKLSRTVVYGVQATLQLAQANSSGPIPCSQIASNGHMPERFLLQILRHLVTHGIMQSTRGVDGGYSLDRTPNEISLLDIIEAIDGRLNASLPGREGAQLSGSEHRLQQALEEVTSAMREQLSAIKISDLLVPHSVAKLA
jgi:Rrf2 family protein